MPGAPLNCCRRLHTQVAGAAAADGATLEQVKAEAEAAAAAVGSVGVATRSCTLPGGRPSDRSDALLRP